MTILVTGVRGNVGRNVVDGLLASGTPVRAASRDPESATVPSGVELVKLDLADPITLPAALDGVRKVFLYAEPHGARAVVKAAAEAGVRHIVLLSSMSAHLDEKAAAAVTEDGNPIAWRHLETERALAESDIPWTFVRPGAFATNSLQWAGTIRAEGVVRLPYPEAQINPIHEKDIADVALAALLHDGHEGAAYPLTGPESLTQRRQVELIGDAAGVPIRVEEQTREQAVEAMSRWLPTGAVNGLLDMFAAAVDRPAEVLDTIRTVTGHPGRTFAEWATDHAADFR